MGGKRTLACELQDGYASDMVRTRQTFANSKDGPIYVSVEPWPECFELEPGDKLTLIWSAAETGDAVQVDFINERELVVWPNGQLDDIEFLINDLPGEDRSWNFKHR
jgi:hypothetical protein